MAKIQALLERTFGFVPDWFIGLGLVCVAILCALPVHKVAVVLAKRAIGPSLRCEVREKLISFLRQEMRDALRCERAVISPLAFGDQGPRPNNAMAGA